MKPTTYKFSFEGVEVEVNNVDPSCKKPIVEFSECWEQTVFDNIEDTGKFNNQQINQIGKMPSKEFRKLLTKQV